MRVVNPVMECGSVAPIGRTAMAVRCANTCWIWVRFGLLATLGVSACGGTSNEVDGKGQDNCGQCLADSTSDGQTPDLGADSRHNLDSATGQDGFEDSHGDAGSDVSIGPGFSPVYEVRKRQQTVVDDPFESWSPDLRYHTGDLLPDLHVSSVARSGSTLWVATPSGLYAAEFKSAAGEPLSAFAHQQSSVVGAQGVVALDDQIVVWNGTKLMFRPLELGLSAEQIEQQGSVYEMAQPVVAVTGCLDTLFVVTTSAVFTTSPGHSPAVLPTPAVTEIRAAACGVSRLWLAAGGDVWSFDGADWTLSWAFDHPMEFLAANQGGLVAASGGDEVAVWNDSSGDGGVQLLEPGAGGLPVGGVTSLAIRADGSVAVGHQAGLSLVGNSGIRHFRSLRYLPSDHVQALLDHEDGLYVGTDAGLVRLTPAKATLQEKAELLFQNLQTWGWRLGGFASASAFFDSPWSDAGHLLVDDDNDGQWTQEAVGALCYAYAATHDGRYYEAARKAVTNMILLIDIPAVSFLAAGKQPGFVARSVVRDDEGAIFDNKATQPNWHLVHYTDGHDYYWKDDTSSDETTGHFFGLPIYYDLCAKDNEERAWIGQHIALLAGYILDNGLLLVDLDGEPTEHGYWNPERLAIALDGLPQCMKNHDLEQCVDAWGGSAFLNSVEILGALLAAWHVSGEQRFYEAYETLIKEHRYDELATFNENVVTWTQRGTANYCDHELADLAFLTLLRYEPSADRRQMWLNSMLDAYQFEIGEHNPLKSLAIAAATATVPGLEQGVETLRQYPLDLRQFRVDNSNRADLEPDVKDRQGNPQFKTVPSYAEIQTMRWDANPYAQAAGGDGSTRMNPAFWLLPYWGLRYHKAIE